MAYDNEAQVRKSFLTKRLSDHKPANKTKEGSMTIPSNIFRAVVAATLVVTSLATASIAAKAATAEVRGGLDANCTGQFDANSGFFRGEHRAQTFTAVNSGKLTEARVSLRKFRNIESGVGVQIRTLDAQGAPSSTVLASTTIPGSAIPADNRFRFKTARFEDARAARVVAGYGYALVMKARYGYSLGLTQSGCPGHWYYTEGPGDPFIQDPWYDVLFSANVVAR